MAEGADIQKSHKLKFHGSEFLVQAIFTALILFHLVAIFLVPISENYLGQKLSAVLSPYVNFMELTAHWSFFAPEIGPPPVFLEWELFDSNRQLLKVDRWPPERDAFFWRERQNRRIAAVRFMVSDEVRAKKMMTPYLCRSQPGVASVRLSKVFYSLPPFSEMSRKDSVKSFGEVSRKISQKVSNEVFERHIISDDYCDQVGST